MYFFGTLCVCVCCCRFATFVHECWLRSNLSLSARPLLSPAKVPARPSVSRQQQAIAAAHRMILQYDCKHPFRVFVGASGTGCAVWSLRNQPKRNIPYTLESVSNALYLSVFNTFSNSTVYPTHFRYGKCTMAMQMYDQKKNTLSCHLIHDWSALFAQTLI